MGVEAGDCGWEAWGGGRGWTLDLEPLHQAPHDDLLSPEILKAGNPPMSLLRGPIFFFLILLLFIYLGLGEVQRWFKIQGTRGYSVQISPPTLPLHQTAPRNSCVLGPLDKEGASPSQTFPENSTLETRVEHPGPCQHLGLIWEASLPYSYLRGREPSHCTWHKDAQGMICSSWSLSPIPTEPGLFPRASPTELEDGAIPVHPQCAGNRSALEFHPSATWPPPTPPVHRLWLLLGQFPLLQGY